MEIQAAILCDSATVREGLLHVLGGGINRLYRSELPAPLGVALALLVAFEPEEVDQLHEVHDRSFSQSTTCRGNGGAPGEASFEDGAGRERSASACDAVTQRWYHGVRAARSSTFNRRWGRNE